MPVHSTELDPIMPNKKCPRNLKDVRDHYNNLFDCMHSIGYTVSTETEKDCLVLEVLSLEIHTSDSPR